MSISWLYKAPWLCKMWPLGQGDEGDTGTLDFCNFLHFKLFLNESLKKKQQSVLMCSSLKFPSPNYPYTWSSVAYSPRGLIERRSSLCFYSLHPPLRPFLRPLEASKSGGGWGQELTCVFLIWLAFLLEPSTASGCFSGCRWLIFATLCKTWMRKKMWALPEFWTGSSPVHSSLTWVSPSLLFYPFPIPCSWHSSSGLLTARPALHPMWRRGKDTVTAQATNNAKNPPPAIVRCLYRGGQGGSVVGLAKPTQPYLLKPKELCDSIQGRGLFKMLTIWHFFPLVFSHNSQTLSNKNNLIRNCYTSPYWFKVYLLHHIAGSIRMGTVSTLLIGNSTE